MSANVKDRHSIMANYPFEQFESDGNQNSIATATIRHGLLVESAPDRDGSFRLRRVTKSIGDGHEGPEALFICPYLGRAYEFFTLLDGSVGLKGERIDIIDLELHEYDVFIDAVIAAVQAFRPPGPSHMIPLG
jgi:hypothetical protein